MNQKNLLEVSETRTIEEIFGLPADEINAIFAEAEQELTPEEETEQELLFKQVRKAQKRAKRLQDCGKFAYWFDPHTGRRTGYPMRCDLFRECPNCLQHRAYVEYERIKKALLYKDLKMITIENQREGTNFIRGVHKTKYIRYPQMDGTEIIFFEREAFDEDTGIEIPTGWIAQQDWTEIVLTPEGRNKSGTGHIISADDDEEPFTIINAKQFVTDAPGDITEKLCEETVEETEDMRPTTPQEVLLCMNRRLRTTVKKLKDRGYDCRIYQKKLKVIHSRIDWSGEMLDFSVKTDFSDSIDLTLNTKNLTRQRSYWDDWDDVDQPEINLGQKLAEECEPAQKIEQNLEKYSENA